MYRCVFGLVGVDVSTGMLEELRARQRQEPEMGGRIKTFHCDVTDLDDVPGVEKGSFDAILCSCAFVLFENPEETVAHWKEYLRPGGLMAIDIPHEWNLRPGLVLEHVAKRLGVKFPSNRSWIESIESFRRILEMRGMAVEDAVKLENISGKGSVFYGEEEADDQFDFGANSSLTQGSVSEGFTACAKPLFREEWRRAAVNGKVESADGSYVYIARKSP